MDITEQNKLIAEFMGLPKINDSGDYDLKPILSKYDERRLDKEYGYHIETMCFASSWDWLMPVVDKIQATGKSGGILYDLKRAIWNVDIEEAHQEAIKFIQWHNTNNKN